MILELLAILTVLFSIALFPTVKVLWRRYRLACKFPGPPAWPIFGNAFVYQGKEPHEYADILLSFTVIYGHCYRIWLGTELNLFFSSVEDVEAILSDAQFNNKSSQYKYLRTWLHEGLLISESRKWVRRRKIITPAFHFRTLEQYVDVFEKHTRRLVKKIKRTLKDCSEVELYSLFSFTALDIVCGKKWHTRRKIITPGFHFSILEEYFHIFEKHSQVFCDVLKKEMESGFIELYQLINRYTMDVISGSKWFKRRKIITPAFHFKILEQYIEIFDRNSCKLLDNLRSQLNKESFDLYFFINLCTLDTICESAMGVSVNAQTNTDSEYVQAVKTISTVLHKRMFDILYRFDLTYMFTKLARDEKRALKILHGFTEKIIIQRREEILKEKQNKDQTKTNTNDIGAKRKMAFLDILLQSEIDGKPLSNLDIREEVDTFMFEGHDTTSSAITFLFFNIARYPEAQKKCFQEILETFGKDKNKPVTFESLNNLHYTELCIKETLRMFPSVPLLGRRVTKECEINGKIVPAGANIGISPLHLGRSEEIYPKAKEFIPERFDVVTNVEKMNPYAYIPFSAGPRNCIGQKFAMLEIKSVVANVLRNFEVEYVESELGEPLLIGELILRTRDPMMFKLKPRVYV